MIRFQIKREGDVQNLSSGKLKCFCVFLVASHHKLNEMSLFCFTAAGCLEEFNVLCSARTGHFVFYSERCFVK